MTSVIRDELDKPLMELWGNSRLVKPSAPGATFPYLIISQYYAKPDNRRGTVRWSFRMPETRSIKVLNDMAEDYSVEEVFNYAISHITGNELRIRCAGDAHMHYLHTLQMNTILERLVCEIEQLASENEELRLRPPGAGGDGYLAAKEHWDSLT